MVHTSAIYLVGGWVGAIVASAVAVRSVRNRPISAGLQWMTYLSAATLGSLAMVVVALMCPPAWAVPSGLACFAFILSTVVGRWDTDGWRHYTTLNGSGLRVLLIVPPPDGDERDIRLASGRRLLCDFGSEAPALVCFVHLMERDTCAAGEGCKAVVDLVSLESLPRWVGESTQFEVHDGALLAAYGTLITPTARFNRRTRASE
jgi:hypothetical protein